MNSNSIAMNRAASRRPSRARALLGAWILVGALSLAAPAANSSPAQGFLAVQRQVETIQPALIRSTVALRMGDGSGSAVLISPDGLALTAGHVISGRSARRMSAVLSDGRVFQATALGLDRETDLGLIKLENAAGLPTAKIGDSAVLRRRQWVLVTGHPLGPRSGRPPVLRIGRIVSLSRPSPEAGPRRIITDAPLISGDSGGPLFDLDGRIVGINSMVTSGGRRMASIHVAVNFAKTAVEQARKGETPARWDGPPPALVAALKQAEAALFAGNTAGAARAAQEAATADPTSAAAQVLLARALSRAGQRTTAATALAAAFDRGFEDLAVARMDPDLAPLSRTASVAPKLARLAALDQLSGDRKGDRAFLAEAAGAAPNLGRGVVRVLSRGQLAALATVMSPDGDLLTKASELPEGALECVLPDGQIVPAERGGVDSAWDVALLRVQATGLATLPLAEGAAVGKWAVSPEGRGAVAAVGVIGVAEMPVRGRGIAPKPTSKAYLGARLEPAPPPVLRESGLAHGIRLEVEENYPAARAGIRSGDLLFEADGQPVRDPDGFMDLLVGKKPGDILNVRVARGAERLTMSVNLTSRPAGLPGRGGLPEMLSGDVSRMQGPFPRVLHHDAMLRPQTMGGPLVDLEGRCIGLNIARADRTSTYAIPARELREIYARLKAPAPGNLANGSTRSGP